MRAVDDLAKVIYKARWVDGIGDINMTTDAAIASAVLDAGYVEESCCCGVCGL